MKDITLNPLDILEKRRLNFLSPHLEPIHITGNYKKPINDWITLKLKGRYFLGEDVQLENNRLVSKEIVAFEDPKEATIFLLSCPYTAKNKV